MLNDAIYIGNVKLNNRLVLAPMAGVTDLAFRLICREFGCGLTVSEMVSAKALVYGDKKTGGLLRSLPEDRPFAAQIFGSEPESMARAAVIALEISGADILDINMGCPVGKIVNNGDGSALMKNPGLAGEIIAAVVSAVSVPVTVKFRKGYDSSCVNAVSFAQTAQDAGAAAVTVHGRTRVQQYSGTADWDIIKSVVQAVSIPVFANGDIVSRDSAQRCMAQTGAAGAAIGRGAMGNPWIFVEILSDTPHDRPNLKEMADVIFRQINIAAQLKGERLACLEARKHFCQYLHGIRNGAFWRRMAVGAETIEDYRKICDDMILNA